MSGYKKFVPGDKVFLNILPPGLVDGLPQDDQLAIIAMIGTPVLFNEIDEYGRAELQFTDGNGIIHFVWVDPDLLTH